MIAIRIIVFLICFVGLQTAWDQLRGTPVEHLAIHDLVVVPATWLINFITPEVHAIAYKFSIISASGGLNILNGCEGMDVLMMIIVAFAVAPLSWRSRIAGASIGVLVVFLINQARVVLLFYAYRANRQWFDELHSTVTPVMVVLLVAMYFYVWLFKAGTDARAA